MEHRSFMEATSAKDERFEALKQLYPELVRDNKLNIDALKDLFDEESFDESDVGYNLYWPGKRNAKKLARKEAEGTLEPVPGDGVNEDKTNNIYIEGDNLEVLRCLKKSYGGRVKMIYIDPPYNTGKDFIYPDNFAEPVEEYLKFTGQMDEKGNSLVANPKSSGAYHRRWLDMMLPRLQLAREILRKDGIICISIDDNEQANLKLICDEVFGEENFEGHIHWRRRHNQPNDKTKMLGLVAEHILVYAKDAVAYKNAGVGKLDLTADFTNPDNDPKGPWASKPWKVGSDQSGSKYDIMAPNGKVLHGEWMGEKATYEQFLAEGRIYFPKGGDGMPRKKYYQSEREEEGQCATNWWSHELFGHNQGGNDEMTTLFGIKNIFSNPKPTKLLLNLYKISNVKKGDIVLDFFSGSASAADALLQYGQANFIMVQIPFDLDAEAKNGCGDSKKQAENAVNFLNSIKKTKHTICEIGKERIRRAGKKILEEHPELKDKLDIGFKVYRLAQSNIEAYKPTTGSDQQSLLNALDAMEKQVTPLREGFDLNNSNDIQKLLTEILLRQGFALNSQIEKTSSIANNIVYRITDEVRPIVLHVCLDREIKPETVKNIVFAENDKFVCLNSAISDELYAQLSDKGRVETI